MKYKILLFLVAPFLSTAQTLFVDGGAILHVDRGSSSSTVLYVDGDLENNGTLVDGGGVEVNGDAELPGSFHFMVGGTAIGTDYAPLFAGGAITPSGGTLDMVFTGGFTPAIGDEFVVLDGGSLSGTFTNMNLPSLGSSRFWAVTYEPAAGTLLLAVSSLLPVELLDFKAVDESGKARLNWSTATEINADRFEVEHSKDGTLFYKIGSEKARGGYGTEQHYTMLHESPAYGINYYRLKSIDLDGAFEYSKLVSIEINQETGNGSLKDMLAIFPNPVSGGELNVVLAQGLDENIKVKMMDTAGRHILSTQLDMGSNLLDISYLPAGAYLLQVVFPTHVYEEKIIVSR